MTTKNVLNKKKLDLYLFYILPAVYSLSFSNYQSVWWFFIGIVVFSKSIEEFLVFEVVVIAHFNVEKCKVKTELRL